MNHVDVLREKIGRLRVEIAQIQEMNNEYRIQGRKTKQPKSLTATGMNGNSLFHSARLANQVGPTAQRLPSEGFFRTRRPTPSFGLKHSSRRRVRKSTSVIRPEFLEQLPRTGLLATPSVPQLCARQPHRVTESFAFTFLIRLDRHRAPRIACLDT